MNKQILYILSSLFLLLSASCTSEEELLSSGETGEIRFSVVDTTQVEVISKAQSGFDVKDFNVSLTRNESVIFSSRKYGDIEGKTISCAAGTGYLLKAESCTEGEAERVNNGWGQARMAGEELFEVKSATTTEVEVKCTLANSSVNVTFSDYVENMFSDCSITLFAADDSERSFTFNKDNHSYKTAYFNVPTSGRALLYTVKLTLPGKEPYESTKTQSLVPSASYKLNVRMSSEDKSKVIIGIEVNGELIGEETKEEVINPYQD